MVSLVVGAAVAALGKWWSPIFGGWEFLAQVVNFLFGLLVATVAFALIYKLMPRVKVQWHDVWVGALVTALLFSLGRFLIGLYIGKSGIASGFGAAGSLIVVFVWVYYSAQIFLMGSEFTWVYAKTFGSMKDVPEVAKANDEGAIPAKQAGSEVAPARHSVAGRSKHSAWADVGAALLVGILVRYGPTLARRRARSH
jgi:membrane protein